MLSSSSPATTRPHPLPAWALSLSLHFLLLSVVAVTFRFTPRGAALGETSEMGIVLVHQDQQQREYVAAEANPGGSSQSAAQTQALADALPSMNEVPVDLPGLELSEADLVGASELASAGSGLDAGTGQGGRGAPSGSARLSVFGVTGVGSKFVFVFDRSGSMDGYGGAPLRAAKRELIQSVQQLQRTHQFQIIFYNERPSVFNPFAGSPRLVWGDDRGKSSAERFVQQMTAGGGTQHLDALRIALGMDPDIVFFLTDADEPRLNERDLQRVRRWNRQAVIHTIEFGYGRQANSRNFLVRLAEQNGGQHAYVDISRL